MASLGLHGELQANWAIMDLSASDKAKQQKPCHFLKMHRYRIEMCRAAVPKPILIQRLRETV